MQSEGEGSGGRQEAGARQAVWQAGIKTAAQPVFSLEASRHVVKTLKQPHDKELRRDLLPTATPVSHSESSVPSPVSLQIIVALADILTEPHEILTQCHPSKPLSDS